MNDNYHIIRIQQYLNGELGGEEMHQLEREALDDPLLQDAIDGYRTRQEVSHRRLSLLQQRLADRIAGQARERNAFYFGWQRLAVAATACVLMVVVLVLLWIRSQPLRPAATEKEVQVELVSPGAEVGVQAVAVSGSGRDAVPMEGWDRFNAYLSENTQTGEATGSVRLTFEVDAAGRPTAIQGNPGADDRLLVEAIRLLEQGPRWAGNKGALDMAFR